MNYKLLISIILVLTNLSIFAQSDRATHKKLERALKLIETQYVDTVNSESLVTAAVEAMIKELDPHSKYLSAESLKKNNEQLNGSFGGVGIYYQILNDTLTVLSVVPNGPSANAGIEAGDKLLTINGKGVTGGNFNNTYFSNQMRGDKGTILAFEVKKHTSKQRKKYEITRGSIPINTINVSYLINKNTGYIKVDNFSRTTNGEFQMALIQLQLLGMHNLILDLRNNPGGLMMASIQMADEFVADERLIVYTQGEHSPRTEYKAKPEGLMEFGKLIVLMDENSASASEIFAGAIQDWDRGIIMGRRSYGKGLVGRNFGLPDGSAVRLITGRYYTPSGRCIQKTYELGNSKAYNADLIKRYNSGEMYSSDSIHFADSLKYYTAAKRLVYGGGAIMPDYFVPVDTSFHSNYLSQINRYGMVNLYAGLYFDQNLEGLQKQYVDPKQFIAEYTMSDDEFDAMNALAVEKFSIELNPDDIQKSKKYVMTYFKATLGRNLFDTGVYYEVFNQEDKMVQEAVSKIRSNKIFKENHIKTLE